MIDLHTSGPSVYLDRWVWIQFACAMKGRPREPGDVEVLAAVQHASAAGVEFTLMSTYYVESLTTRARRQRIDLARTIASISNCCALRSRRELLRHRMLHAMWMHFGLHAFRPSPPEPLGVEVFWAFLGKQLPLRISGPEGPLDLDTIPGLLQRLRQMAQWEEVQFSVRHAQRAAHRLAPTWIPTRGANRGWSTTSCL
jgi:hypothetical protein